MGLEDHAGRAESALKGIMLNKGLLQWVQLPVFFQAFNRDDFSTIDVFYERLAGGRCLIIHKHGTCTAYPFPAAILCACETDIRAKHPEKASVAVNFNADRLVIERETDFFCHRFSPFVLPGKKPVKECCPGCTYMKIARRAWREPVMTSSIDIIR
jgi:hypothetical protein